MEGKRVGLSLEGAHALAVRVLAEAEVLAETASIVAKNLVAAEADGISSHGFARLPAYFDQLASGKLNGRAVAAVTTPAPGVVHVDANEGFGYTAIAAGLDRARGLVQDQGVVGVAVTNSNYFGVAGHHVEAAAEHGLVALLCGNSPAAIAPWGGKVPLFGTNPIAFACPREGKPPLVIDMSLSKVARGKVMVAAQQKQPIPEGWALDAEGNPTRDAEAALAGTMLPMGDAKGAMLVLMVEILAAALTGAKFGFEASSSYVASGAPPRIGQFLLLIDPKPFSRGAFASRLEALLGLMIAQQGVRLPGDRRFRRREAARKEGIALPLSLYEQLRRRVPAIAAAAAGPAA